MNRDPSFPEFTPEIARALDACRPGASDLTQPEMAELSCSLVASASLRQLRARLEQLDHAVAGAIQSGDVPADLEARLLAAVARETDAGGGQVTPRSRSAAWADAGPWRSRRALLAVAGTLALLAAGFFVARSWRSTTPESVARAAVAWIEQLDPAAWREWEEGPGVVSSVQPSRAVSMRAEFSQELQTRWGPAIVIRDARAPGVYQFILAVNPGGAFPDSPPPQPQHASQESLGLSIGVWQVNGVTYVLAVEGDEARYREYVASNVPFA